ncbi:MAG: hypothetical protein WDM79_18635 [Terricaulis sp.]
MARSLLQSFVSGTRQMLTLQLFVGVAAVALAGWTMGVTNDLIRERDALKARVGQLETEMGIQGVEVPAPIAPVETTEVTPAEEPVVTEETATTTEPTQTPTVPGFRTLLLHIRSEDDRPSAQLLARALSNTGLAITIDAGSWRQRSGYSFHDQGQSEQAASLYASVRSAAAELKLEAWSGDLPGAFIEGEPADQFDLWLPRLPVREAAEPETQVPPVRTADVAPPAAAPAAEPAAPAFDPGAILRQVLQPAPALQTVVLHIRSEADRDEAVGIARRLSASGVRVSIEVAPANDQSASGYAYYDPRQSRPAAAIAAQLQSIARENQIEPWAAGLRGVAFPPSADYGATRLDFVLPPLPAPSFRQQLNRATVVQPQVAQPPR